MGLGAERGSSAHRRSQLPARYLIEHFSKELHDVRVANDGSEEEICDEGRRDGFQGGGDQQNAGEAALVLRVQGLQHLLKRSLGFLLEALDVQGGPQPRDVCRGTGEKMVMKEAGKTPQLLPIPPFPFPVSQKGSPRPY